MGCDGLQVAALQSHTTVFHFVTRFSFWMVHVKTQWECEFFTLYAAAYSIFTPYAAATADSLSSYDTS
jgi:hypothetical protein